MMTIAGQKQWSIQVDMISGSGEQAGGSNSERSANHAADQYFKAMLASPLSQQQGFSQPACLVQLYIDRVVAVNQTREIRAGVAAFIRADRHGMVQSLESIIRVRGKWLLDELNPECAQRRSGRLIMRYRP